MNSSHANSSSSARPRPSPMASFRSWRRSAASSIKITINNVASSVATVQANRSANGPGDSGFLGQVRDQLNRDRAQRREEEIKGQQKLALFPGWAVRRFPDSQDSSRADAEFDVDVFVSGHAFSLRPPEYASRSQRAFMKIAKGFASLPKVPSNQSSQTIIPVSHRLSRSTEDLLKMATLPPRPDEMTPEIEAKILASHAQLLSAPLEPPRPSFLGGSEKVDLPKFDPPVDPPPDADDLPSLYSLDVESSSSLSSTSTTASTGSQGPTSVSFAEMLPSELLKLHANFDSRLQPFWSSVVTNRTVRVSLFPTHSNGQPDRHHGAIAMVELPLSDQGYFGHLFRISYESFCTHPGGLHIAFGDRMMEHPLVAAAELLPPPPPVGTTRVARPLSVSYIPAAQSQLHYTTPTAQMTIPLADARVRVISDIDDTIKISNILHGARAVFRNVFVRNLDELAVPGMPEWYTSLSQRGVRFHYVSNSPFELLPVLSEFFRVTGLPTGSLKLKFYGGKSLFKGLWEPAGERKRSGVVEIMEQFPESKFLLIGDSGEQDLELYASLAKDFAQRGRHQILGIFIRDVTPQSDTPHPNRQQFSSRTPSPVSSMYGGRSQTPSINSGRSSWYFSPTSPPRSMSMDQLRNSSHDTEEAGYLSQADYNSNVYAVPPTLQDRNLTIRPSQHQQPQPHRAMSFPLRDPGSLPPPPRSEASPDIPTRSLSSSILESPTKKGTTSPSTGPPPSLRSALDKKRAELRMRIARARSEIPPGVVFKVFAHPEECFSDVEDILSKCGVGPPGPPAAYGGGTGGFWRDVDAS